MARALTGGNALLWAAYGPTIFYPSSSSAPFSLASALHESVVQFDDRTFQPGEASDSRMLLDLGNGPANRSWNLRPRQCWTVQHGL